MYRYLTGASISSVKTTKSVGNDCAFEKFDKGTLLKKWRAPLELLYLRNFSIRSVRFRPQRVGPFFCEICQKRESVSRFDLQLHYHGHSLNYRLLGYLSISELDIGWWIRYRSLESISIGSILFLPGNSLFFRPPFPQFIGLDWLICLRPPNSFLIWLCSLLLLSSRFLYPIDSVHVRLILDTWPT